MVATTLQILLRRRHILEIQNLKVVLHVFWRARNLVLSWIIETHSGPVALGSLLSGADQILSVAKSLVGRCRGSSCVYLRAPRGQRLPGAERQTDGWMDRWMNEWRDKYTTTALEILLIQP